jgi:hypothetical protein
VLGEDAVVDEAVEPVREHVARDAEPLLEVLEAVDPVKGVANHQHGPAIADRLEGAGDRTHLVVVGTRKHSSTRS